MSILQQVIDEYGISENSISPTDKTDKRVKSPGTLPDKTDKRASVSSVSDRSGDSEKQEAQAMAELTKIIEMRERGQVPDHYTSTTTLDTMDSTSRLSLPTTKLTFSSTSLQIWLVISI